MNELVTGIVAGTATHLEGINPSYTSSSTILDRKMNVENQITSTRHLHQFSHRHLNKHHQHEASVGFISNEDLAARLIEGYLPTIVIDTRDDDVTCGQIRGALLCPEHCFGPKQVQRDSIKKSLRCAHKFHQALRDLGHIHGITVKVLRGGAESWFKRYEKDHRLVQDFDDTFSMEFNHENRTTCHKT